MKRLLVFILLLIGYSSFAQAQSYVASSVYGKKEKRIEADSTFHLPFLPITLGTTLVPSILQRPGALAVSTLDTCLYMSLTGLKYDVRFPRTGSVDTAYILSLLTGYVPTSQQPKIDSGNNLRPVAWSIDTASMVANLLLNNGNLPAFSTQNIMWPDTATRIATIPYVLGILRNTPTGLSYQGNWTPSNTAPTLSPVANQAWFVASTGSTNITGSTITVDPTGVVFWNGTAWIYALAVTEYNRIAQTNSYTSNNLMDSTIVYGTSASRWSTSTGGLLGTAGWVRTAKMDVLPNTVYTVKFLDGTSAVGSRKDILFWDASNVYINSPITSPTSSNAVGAYTFTTPASTGYVAFNLSSSTQTSFTFQLNKGGLVKSYEDPSTIVYTYVLKGSPLEKAFRKDSIVSNNLYDSTKQIIGTLSALYAFNNTGTIVRYVTVPARENSWMNISNWNLTTAAKKIAFYDTLGALISGAVGTAANSIVFETPAGTGSLVVNTKSSVDTFLDNSQLQIEYGKGASVPRLYDSTRYYTSSVNGLGLKDVYDSLYHLNILSSSKIFIFGPSYTQGVYHVKGKGMVANMSQYVPYEIFNYGVSGNKVIDELQRFRDNTNGFGAPPNGLKGTTIFIANEGNETLFGYNSDWYIKYLKEFALWARSNGALVIFSTEHRMSRSGDPAHPWMESVIAGAAKEVGAYFIPSGTWGIQVLNGNQPTQFWAANHPGTRTNNYQAYNLAYYFNQLSNPSQTIKIYRKRSTITPSTIDDLNYQGTLNKAKIWKEICTGETSLTESDSSFKSMDNLTAGSFTFGALTNEYGSLAQNINVPFTDYGLFEATLRTTYPEYITIKIKTQDSTGMIFYLKDNKSSAPWEITTSTNATFNVDSTTYAGISATPGAIYRSPDVKVGASQVDVTYTGKAYDPIPNGLGYMIGFSYASTSTVKTNHTGTLTKQSGTGNSTIAYTALDPNLENHITAYQNRLAPMGGYDTVSATYSRGYYTITIGGQYDIQRYLNFDKLNLIAYKSGGYNISDIQIDYKGGTFKQELPAGINIFGDGTELISNTGIDATGTGYVGANGASIGHDIFYQSYPPLLGSATGVYHYILPLNSNSTAATLKTSVTFNPTSGTRKMIIRVIPRLGYKVYKVGSPESDTTTAIREITPDSYDNGTLKLAVVSTGGVGYAVYTFPSPVGPGWTLNQMSIDIPPFTSGVDLVLFRDNADMSNANYNKPLQICYWSAQIENK